jgi:hypothetical protein
MQPAAASFFSSLLLTHSPPIPEASFITQICWQASFESQFVIGQCWFKSPGAEKASCIAFCLRATHANDETEP